MPSLQAGELTAHVRHGLGGVAETQHGQGTVHGTQARTDRLDEFDLRGVADELVELLLRLGKGQPELAGGRRGGLAFESAPVEGGHPALGRQRLIERGRLLDARGQLFDLFAKPRVLQVTLLQHGLDHKQGGGDFHRQRVARGGLVTVDASGRLLQRHRQAPALGQQALGGIPHERELLAQGGLGRMVGSRRRRPDLARGRDAASRLGQPDRVETAKPRGLVVVRRMGVQPEGLAQGAQPGYRPHGVLGLRLGAEEDQFAGQLRAQGRGRGAGAGQSEDARRDALRVDVQAQGSRCLGLEEGRGKAPQRG